jgi:hypothetical protein
MQKVGFLNAIQALSQLSYGPDTAALLPIRRRYDNVGVGPSYIRDAGT